MYEYGGVLAMDIQNMLKRIDETKAEIGKRRPLCPEEVNQLDAYFRIKLTYSSNALEGNTLDLTETKILLEDGLTVGGKPIRDCYEAIGHGKAYDFMLEAARSTHFNFSESMILQLHKLFYQGIEPEKAGVYRDIQVFISGTDYMPPQPEDVPTLMKELEGDLVKKWNSLHPLRIAALAHRKLVNIHPFVDGNGRTARLLMNLILINRGYQIVSIPPILRREYISALKVAQREKNPSDEAFMCFIAECEIEAQKDFCRMLHIQLPKKEYPAKI
jgi:Fic family protein